MDKLPSKLSLIHYFNSSPTMSKNARPLHFLHPSSVVSVLERNKRLGTAIIQVSRLFTPRSAACSDVLVFFLCVKARTFLYPFPTVNLSVAVGVRTDVAVSQYLRLRVTPFKLLQQLHEACLLLLRAVVNSLALRVDAAHVGNVHSR